MKILSINCYEAAFSNKTKNLYIAAPVRTPSLDFLNHIIPKNRIIPLIGSRTLEPFINDEEVIAETDIGQKIRDFGITHFLPSYRSSTKIESWAKKHKLKILFAPVSLQKRLENKIYFDRLLKQHQIDSPLSLVLGSIKDTGLVKFFPAVVQLPESEGSEGTFIIKSSKDLALWWKKYTPKKALIRQFIDGLPLGVTIIVSKTGLILSALRAQVSTPLSPRNTPFGIQWIASKALSSASKRNVEENLIKVGEALRAEGYLGVANIDFILRKDQSYLIECNPRFSAATSQLALNPKLLHNCDLTSEHIHAFLNKGACAQKRSLPPTIFEGCSLELTDLVKKNLKLKTKVNAAIPKIGYYYLNKNQSKCSPRLPSDKRSKLFFFYTSLSTSKRIFEETSLASIYTNFPCYKVYSNKLAKNRDLESLLCLATKMIG